MEKIEIELDGKHQARIVFTGEDIGMINAIRGIVLNDENVDFASVNREHPELDKIIFTIKVKRGDPVKIVERAAEKLAKIANDLRKTIK